MQVGASQGINIQKNENKTQTGAGGKTINGLFDQIRDIAIDSNDDVILVGDYFVKLDGDDGSILWSTYKQYSHVEIDSSNNIIAGVTHTSGAYGEDEGYKVAKYDTNGNMIYANIYNKLNYGRLKDLSIDSNDNIIMTGYIREIAFPPWPSEIWTIKVDGETGEILAESNQSEGYLITVDSEDNIILIGTRFADVVGIRVTKFNNNLEKQWTTYTNYTTHAHSPKSVTTDSEDNIIVCGIKTKPGDPNFNFSYFKIKFNKNGAEVWDSPVIYDDPLWYDQPKHVTVDSQDNIIVCGDSGPESVGGYKEWHNIKYDKDGNELWNLIVENAMYATGGVAVDSADNIIFSGSAYTYQSYGYLTIKCNENGVKLWTNEPDFGDRPNEPSIHGMVHGAAGVEYTYTIVSTDPDGDDVYYYVEWGDGNNSGYVGPYASGEEVEIKHTWQSKGEYEIRVKAKDEIGHTSSWGYLFVTMPRNQASNNPILKFLQDHPVLSQFLQLISQNMKTNLFS